MRLATFIFSLLFGLSALGQTVGVRISTNTALTQGDQVIWSGSAWVTYGKGTNGQVLTMDGSNVVWATPSGGGGGGSGTVTSVGASTTVSGLGFSGSPVTTSGTLSLTGTVAVASGGTGATDASTARSNLGVLSSRWLTGFGSPSDYSEGIGTYYVNLETYQVWEQTGVSTFETIPFFVMGEGVYSYLDQPNTFANTNTFAGPVVLLSGISGNGTLLTNLNGTEIRSGTVAAARLDPAMATDTEVTAATAEATLEAVLDLQDLQGTVSDAQVPNTITVDLATTATTANSGDSATAFFSSGEIEDARLPSGLSRDAEVSATYAPLASPALTGSPTVPTASAASSNTVAASTAYVDRAVASGGGGGGTWDGTPIASGTITNLITSFVNGVRPFNPQNGDIWSDGYQVLVGLTAAFEPWSGASVNSGTANNDTSFTGSANDPMRIIWASASGANSGSSLSVDARTFLVAGGEQSVHTVYIYKTNATVLRAGYLDVFSNTEPTDGVYLEMVGGVLYGKTSSNSSRTETVSRYTVAENSTLPLGLHLLVNSAASSVTFAVYTNGVSAWTDTVTNNIPTGAGRYTGHGAVAYHTGSGAGTNIIAIGALGALQNRVLLR